MTQYISSRSRGDSLQEQTKIPVSTNICVVVSRNRRAPSDPMIKVVCVGYDA